MDPSIAEYIRGIELGEVQAFRNMAVLPLLASTNGGPEYLTLKEALDAELITIAEVDRSGSVPDLKVVNPSEQCVLLLEGEELIGAKQNRVLNTSILLRAQSETIIPVSCTEAGRWAYSSPSFEHSGVVVPPEARARMSRSVSDSVVEGRRFSSDQSQVWSDVLDMHLHAGTSSTTSAMRDVYAAKGGELEAYFQAFERVPGQQGILVFVNGKIAGFDIVSRSKAYDVVHAQLIKSYAMDAFLRGTDTDDTASVDDAVEFLNDLPSCKETRAEAVGQGYDYRYRGDQIAGSALVCEQKVVHVSFFGG